ncbi:MAG: haloacid dehalogenase [Candidatus Brockarchaeota archaeon]|nr:haloacid dehalogenase [Candidatus Brockarchaeota archaeon]
MLVELKLLKGDLKKIQSNLEKFDESRERALQASRTATRLSDWAIIQIHRGDLKEAEKTLKKARISLRRMEKFLRGNPELKYFGNIIVAYQEYAEAMLLFRLTSSGRLPSLREVGVESTPYILGLLDFIGELRRMTLNFLRKGKALEAEETLKLMEEVYENIFSLNHTAIIPTFRGKMDAARRIIETTRGDVVTEVGRLSLEKAIRDLEKNVRGRRSAEV